MKRNLLCASMWLALFEVFGSGINHNANGTAPNHLVSKATSQITSSLQEDFPKIIITRDQAIVLTPQEETLMNMFDGDPQTTWFPGWGAMYPALAMADLRGTFTIKKFRFKNYTGSRVFKIYGGKDPMDLKLLVEHTVAGYNEWSEVNLSVDVKYLRFEIPGSKTDSPAELEIYGKKIADAATITGPEKFVVQANVNGIFGANSFHWVDPKNETNLLYLREYVETEWIQQEDDKYRFNPASGGDAMLDDHYAQLKSLGIEVMPCIKGTLPWTRNADYQDSEFKPVYPLNADPTLPKSYKDQAEFQFQFAARYGHTKVDASLLEIDARPRWNADPINVKKTGLGYVKYFECWNESDKDWKGTKGYMTPYEFAAYMSAVADGHCNTLGPKTGIKNADPTAKIVMGGLAGLSIDYVKAMVLWFQTYRPDRKVPIDAFNFHHYSNSAGFQHTPGSYGISPEQDNLRDKLKKLKTYVDTYLPGKEIYLSEYGYDTNVGSVQRCPSIGTMSQVEVQGIWNTRAMLELMASQINKSYVYMMYDEITTQDSWTVYANSGMLTSKESGYQKKPAWFYISTLKEALKDYTFVADESPNANVRKYKFMKGSNVIYAIWLTSSTDAKASHKLNITAASTGELIKLADKNEKGVRSTITINSATEIAISERPVFVSYNEAPVAPANIAPKASAGTDQTLTLPTNTIVIKGKGTDTDGTIATYAWTKVSGPTATLSKSKTANLSLSNLIAGEYKFRLTVSDNLGAKGTDDMILKVAEAGIAVNSLTLVDADKDIDIAPLTQGYTLNLSNHTCTFSFVANTTPAQIGSVKFLYDGAEFKTVKGSPYSFTDNCWPGYNCYNSWWKPTIGTHTVTAIPYSLVGGTGVQGQPYSITFTVTDKGIAPAASTSSMPDEEITSITSQASESSMIISAAPNPVKDLLILNANKNISNGNLELVDALGHVYYKNSDINGSQIEVPLEELGMIPGIYFAKITTNQSEVKLIKVLKD